MPKSAAILATALALLLAGCTYLETKERLVRTEAEIEQAKADLENAEDEQVSLERDQERAEEQQQAARTEAQTLEQELAALDAKLAQAKADLDRARQENRVSRDRYAELQRAFDQLRFEEDTARLSAAPDAEKQKKLAELQKRKQGLIEAIRTLGSS